MLAGLALPACVPSPTRRSARLAPGRTRLVPVQVSEDRLIRTVAGLRPYRPSGFRVEAESMGEKLVIHNYGHGGAGITLSWGTAEMAVEHALAQPHRQAAVLGCGAVGLATARLLQDRGFKVRIYARDLPPNTTSNIAGALWSPVSVASWARRESPFAQKLARASRFAHRYFQSMVGERYGIRWLPLYLLNENPGAGVPWTWQLAPELYHAARLQPEEHPFPRAGAWRAYAMMIEPDPYLRALLQDFRVAGGEVIVRELPDRAAVLALPEPVVINCTGLGAKALFGDEELVPVKGQLAFLVPQPDVDYMYVAGEFYMFPRRDGILLGGTHEGNTWSTEPDPAATERILIAHGQLALGMR